MHNLMKLSTLAVAAGALMLTAPGSAGAGDLDGQEIKVCTWGGSWRDIQRDEIVLSAGGLKERGAEVVYVTASPQDNMAKLIAARGAPVCDVIEILDATWDDMVELDFVVDELDFSLIPNAKDLPKWLVGKNFTGSWFTQEGICYNSAKFKANGIPVPTTYKDLVNPKLEGLLQIPDITSGGGLANFGGIVKAAGGDSNNVKPGLELIEAMKIRKFWKRGSESNTLMDQGDIWAYIGHVGWCMRGHKAGQTDNRFVHPIIDAKHIGLAKHGFLSIVKNSPKEVRAAAHAYINGYLSEATQFAMSTRAGTLPVNEKVLPRLSKDPVLSMLAKLDPAEIAKEYKVEYKGIDKTTWTDQWNRSVSQ